MRPKSRYTDHWMSEPDVSMARPQEFKHVLTRMKATLNGTEELLAEFAEQLGRWRAVTTRSSGMAGLDMMF